MPRTALFLCFSLLAVIACQPKNNPRKIIDEAINAHGGDAYQNKRIEFDFRQFHLVLEQQDGRFRYTRTHRDSTGTRIEEVLTNDGLTRTLNGQRQALDTTQTKKYSEAVNAVAYFALLPHKLADPAVLADYIGESRIEGQTYDKIRVQFRAEDGGNDHGDTFFYWFNQQSHTMDYLAYSEGGPRFRKAINPQIIGGIRFQDYINYKGDPNDTTSVSNYDRRYEAHQLPELSRIEQKNIRVTTLP
ncbi:DUF6503 family protein [Spirosoma areae]